MLEEHLYHTNARLYRDEKEEEQQENEEEEGEEENWPKKGYIRIPRMQNENGGKTRQREGRRKRAGRRNGCSGPGVSDTCFNAYRSTWCIWVTLTPQSVFQSPSTALHCGVFTATAAQDRDHRRRPGHSVPGQGKKGAAEGDDGGGGGVERALEFADGEAGNFYREGTKGCGDERGGLRRFMATFFFFWGGNGGSFRGGGQDRSIFCVFCLLLCRFGNEKLNWRKKMRLS